MKALFLSFWVLVGLVVGIAFGGYVEIRTKDGYKDQGQQLFNMAFGAAVGIGCGFGIGTQILDLTKDK